MVEGRGSGESASGLRLLSLPDTASSSGTRRPRAAAKTRPRGGISLLPNTHKSTSLLKGSEIGKARCNPPSPLRRLSLPRVFTVSSCPPGIRGILVSPSLSLSLSRSPMSGRVCIPRAFLGGQLSREKHTRAPTILSDPRPSPRHFECTRYRCFLRDKGSQADGPTGETFRFAASRCTLLRPLCLCFFKPHLCREPLREYFSSSLSPPVPSSFFFAPAVTAQPYFSSAYFPKPFARFATTMRR